MMYRLTYELYVDAEEGEDGDNPSPEELVEEALDQEEHVIVRYTHISTQEAGA